MAADHGRDDNSSSAESGFAEREDELVSALSRHIVAETAPEELPLFRSVSRVYLEHGGRLPASGRQRDEMLGFGAEAAVALLTPVVLDVAKTVVSFLLTRARAAVAKRAGDAVDDAVARAFARLLGAKPAQHEPHLVPAELEEVRRLAYERARALDLPEEKATLLADSLVGGLA